MGLFDKFKKQPTTVNRNFNIETLGIDTSSWFEVFSACLGKMVIIQEACADLIVKNRDWNVDFSKGTISFGKDEYPLQFLGSESTNSNSWMWGWNNINQFSESLIKLAESTKSLGEKWKLEPLTITQFELDDTFNGHNLAIATCGLSDHYCYYRCPHANGAAFVAFSDVPDKVFAPVDLVKFADTVVACVKQFHVDHKIFTEAFLMWNGTPYEWKDNEIVAHFQKDLHIKFEQVDEFLRICAIKAG